MNCIEVEKQIDLLPDGEINSLLGDELKKHLASCRSCRQTFEKLLLVDTMLKKPVSLPRTSRMDARVMRAFENHHRKTREFKQPVERPGLLRNWRFFPKTSFALAAVLIAALLGLAFQLGRMSAGSAPVEISKAAVIDPPAEPVNNPLNHSPEYITKSEAQAVLPAPLPPLKEKIITRVVYIKTPQKSDGEKRAGAAATPSIPLEDNKTAPKTTAAKNEFVTVAALKGFQTVSNLKATIIRKGENNED